MLDCEDSVSLSLAGLRIPVGGKTARSPQTQCGEENRGASVEQLSLEAKDNVAAL